MKSKQPSVVLTTISVLALASSLHAATITSTFDTGSDGWTYNEGTFMFVSSGGNPGGHLELSDTGPGFEDFAVFAPSKFLGDLSAFNRGMLSFDWVVLFHVPGACIDPLTPVT